MPNKVQIIKEASGKKDMDFDEAFQNGKFGIDLSKITKGEGKDP